MDNVIFKNPTVTHRKERFGGLVNNRFMTYILNKEQYNFLKNLKKFRYYNALNLGEKKIADILLEKRIILKLDSKTAEKIIYNSKQL